MRAILIDPEVRDITYVEYDDSDYTNIYRLIDAQLFDVVRINENGDVLYVDDEGLYNARAFFAFAACPTPVAGKALVLGTGSEGQSIEPTITLEQVQQWTGWLSIQEAIRMAELADQQTQDYIEEHQQDGVFHTHVPIAGILKDRVYDGEPE